MGEYVLTLLAAAAVTYLLTPAVRRLAVAVGALHAARDRDVHVVPTPLLGGFAMYAGLAAGLLVASRIPGLTPAFAQPNMARGLLLAGGLVVLMGFVDDRWGLSALSKLAGQVAAGVILVWSGAEVTWLPLPGGGAFALTPDQQIAATILVVVVTINAINFIDGLDGLAAGIVGIGAAAFFFYYYTLTHRLGLPDQTGPALASAVLVGMCLGFLPHNFHPARIFMGDTGAMLLGLLLAYAPISSLASLDPASLTDPQAFHTGTVNRFGTILPLLVPAAIMLIPYADLLMAVIRRSRVGTSVFTPDKKHLQHRLLAIGHSHRTSVLIMYLWAGLFAASVVWLSIIRTSLYVLIVVTGAAVLALALVSMPRLRPWARAASAKDAPQPAVARASRRAPAEPGPAWAPTPGPEPGWPAPGQQPVRTAQGQEPNWAVQKQAPDWAEREQEPAWTDQRQELGWQEPARAADGQERAWPDRRQEPDWASAAAEEAARRAPEAPVGNGEPSQDDHPWFSPRVTRPTAPAQQAAPGDFSSASQMPTVPAEDPSGFSSASQMRTVPAEDPEATNPIPAVPPAGPTRGAPSSQRPAGQAPREFGRPDEAEPAPDEWPPPSFPADPRLPARLPDHW